MSPQIITQASIMKKIEEKMERHQCFPCPITDEVGQIYPYIDMYIDLGWYPYIDC